MDMVMDIMDMESVMLMLNQKLRPMLSMVLMEGMAMDLDTVLTPWDMDMGMAMDLDTVLTPWDMDTGMAMDLDTVLTPWDMDMDMAMGIDMDIMVELSDSTNQEW